VVSSVTAALEELLSFYGHIAAAIGSCGRNFSRARWLFVQMSEIYFAGPCAECNDDELLQSKPEKHLR
jgi:hypothetical protein